MRKVAVRMAGVLFFAISFAIREIAAQTPLVAPEVAVSEEWKLYMAALEQLADGDEVEGFRLLRELADKYPDSPAAEKARRRLAAADFKKDRSGIAGFYLGTMATTFYAFNSIPAIAGANWGPLGAGLLGLAGVGGGATAAWLLTKDRDWTAGQEWWTETLQAVAVTNASIATLTWMPDLIEDSGVLSQASVAVLVSATVGSRTAAYLAVRDAELTIDRPVLAASAYAWAQFYTLLTVYGLLELNDPDISATASIIVPDTAFIGAALAYDRLRWSSVRTGLIDVAGIGGLLVGACVNLIAGAAIDTDNAPLAAGIHMAGAAAGTAVGILLTGDTDRSGPRSPYPRPVLFLPVIGKDGSLGAAVRLAF